MGKKRRQKPVSNCPTASYPLQDVRALVAANKYHVNTDVLQDARNDFGWEVKEVVAAILKLQPKHFYKASVLHGNAWVAVDIYKACRINGEDIYTHFYVHPDTDRLIINSFKRLQQ